jgi:putative ABC transport system substrate-binding protein
MRLGSLVLAMAVYLTAVVAAVAQPAAKVYRIGYLGTFPPDPQGVNWSALVRGLRERGYVEGQNLHIERRFSDGNSDRLPALVAELLGLRVSLIVTSAPGPSRAAKEATATIPIVFVGVGDPVGLGLVTSLARPGGNVTGLTSIEWETFTAKQLEILKEALPNISRVAILMNPTNRSHSQTLPQAQAAARKSQMSLQLVEARDAGDLDRAFEAATRGRADVLHVWGDALTHSQRSRIAELAMKHRLPTLHFFREAVEGGGLLSFGPDWSHVYGNVGTYVDKILKGTRPADLPVAQPTKYELTVNLKTAKALGLTIPPSLLLRADHVIE